MTDDNHDDGDKRPLDGEEFDFVFDFDEHFEFELAHERVVDDRFDGQVCDLIRRVIRYADPPAQPSSPSVLTDELAGATARVWFLASESSDADQFVISDAFVAVARQALKAATEYGYTFEPLDIEGPFDDTIANGYYNLICWETQVEHPLDKTTPSDLLEGLLMMVCRIAGLRRMIDPRPEDEEWSTTALRDLTDHAERDGVTPHAWATSRFRRVSDSVAALAIYAAVAFRGSANTDAPGEL